MNSVRPLVTVTILAVVGVWLYVKINQGPAVPTHGEAAGFDEQSVEGVPPLGAPVSAPLSDGGTAPTWPPATAVAPPAAAPQATPTTLQPAPQQVRDMPAIPALPDVSNDTQPAPSTNASTPVPVSPSVNIPMARYPDTAGATAENSGGASLDAIASAPTDTANPDAVAVSGVPTATPQAVPTETSDHESAIASDSAMAAVGLSHQAQSSHSPTTGTDPYGLSSTNPIASAVPAAASSPVEPTFAEAWPEIQAVLDQRQLARAHELLSKWYGDASLSPAESEKVNALLDQLAGTVVYSTEHQLEPAYVVKSGDTLATIAQQYNVPWQLLAKINGIPSADSVQPGQSLKVIRGPFSAFVDLGQSQLTLMLNRCYAGKFHITVPNGSTVDEGRWLVEQKLVTAPARVTQTSYSPSPAAVDRAIILRGEDASTGKLAATGATLTIASAELPSGGVGSQPAIRVSPQDAEELSDILSVGSRVVIRR